jgi:hypothetical protein
LLFSGALFFFLVAVLWSFVLFFFIC